MKLVVQDFLRCKQLFVLDTDTGALHGLDPSEAEAPTATVDKPSGYVTKLGGTPVVFYAEAGRLRLRLGDETHVLSGPVQVELAGEGLRTLRVRSGEEVLARLSYPNPVNPPMEFDLTLAEEEDFDLGLYIKNVMASHQRKTHLLTRWS